MGTCASLWRQHESSESSLSCVYDRALLSIVSPWRVILFCVEDVDYLSEVKGTSSSSSSKKLEGDGEMKSDLVPLWAREGPTKDG